MSFFFAKKKVKEEEEEKRFKSRWLVVYIPTRKEEKGGKKMHTHNTKSQEEMICEDFLFHFTTLKQEKVIKKWNTLFLLP